MPSLQGEEECRVHHKSNIKNSYEFLEIQLVLGHTESMLVDPRIDPNSYELHKSW